MRAAPFALLLVATAAHAAPVASLAADLGSGTEKIEVDAAGTLRIGSATVALGTQVTHATLSAAVVRSVPTVVVDTEHEAIVVEKTGGTWKERMRQPVGGVGLDADYATEIRVLPFEPQVFGQISNNGQVFGEGARSHKAAAVFRQLATALGGRQTTDRSSGTGSGGGGNSALLGWLKKLPKKQAS